MRLGPEGEGLHTSKTLPDFLGAGAEQSPRLETKFVGQITSLFMQIYSLNEAKILHTSLFIVVLSFKFGSKSNSYVRGLVLII